MSTPTTPSYESVAIHPLVAGAPNKDFPQHAGKRVLVIYTGGTIGSKPKDPDPDSPQVVTRWEELAEKTPEIGRLQFPVDCIALVKPLDSCNVGPAEWARMAQIIQEHYENYQGFVVLHGTDTMSNTASALAFMLVGLSKPVVLTGAQISAMVSVRNDATQNIIGALMLANPAATGIPVIPEVCVYFGGRILRGCRTNKDHTASFTPFDSPNMNWLGELGQKINVDTDRVLKKPETSFGPRLKMEPRVVPIDVSPGIQDTTVLQEILKLKDIKAVILRAYGTGDLPTKPEFMRALKEARDEGKVVAVVTQCPHGPVELGIYDTSAQLVEAGLVAAYDITPQAAHTKLMHLLGMSDLDQEEVEERFQRSLVGEQSRSIWLTKLPGKGKVIAGGETLPNPTSVHRIKGKEMRGTWKNTKIVTASLRLKNATFTCSESHVEEIRLWVLPNWDEGLPLTGAHAVVRRSVPKQGEEPKPGLAILDVTNIVRPIAQPNSNISFTIAPMTPGAEVAWDGAELALVIDETVA